MYISKRRTIQSSASMLNETSPFTFERSFLNGENNSEKKNYLRTEIGRVSSIPFDP